MKRKLSVFAVAALSTMALSPLAVAQPQDYHTENGARVLKGPTAAAAVAPARQAAAPARLGTEDRFTENWPRNIETETASGQAAAAVIAPTRQVTAPARLGTEDRFTENWPRNIETETASGMAPRRGG